MKKFVIERLIPGIGMVQPAGIAEAAATSNAALSRLAPRVQWIESFVTNDKTFCIYLAEDEDAITEHARLSGIPATVITQVTAMMDPTTGN